MLKYIFVDWKQSWIYRLLAYYAPASVAVGSIARGADVQVYSIATLEPNILNTLDVFPCINNKNFLYLSNMGQNKTQIKNENKEALQKPKTLISFNILKIPNTNFLWPSFSISLYFILIPWW